MQAGWSQQYVAQKLGVSIQAISKWENGKSDPDISFLVPLSNLFHVSADELLDNRQRRNEWHIAWLEVLLSDDDREKLEVLINALEEFPNDHTFKYNLACEEFFLALSETDPKKRTKLLSLSDVHFSSLREERPEFLSALDMHVRVLAALGRKDEASELAKASPNYDRLLLSVLEGEELIDQKRKLAALSLLNLYADLMRIGSVEAAEKAKALIADVASGEEQFFGLLIDVYYYQAILFCEEKEYEAAIDALTAEYQLVQSYKTEGSKRGEFFYPLFDTKSKAEIRALFQEHIRDGRFTCLHGIDGFEKLMIE